jgi:hypothetical protein
MQLPDFEYGLGAIVAPGQQDSFDTCAENLIADTRPGNFLEQLVVDQLLHAQWELHRVNSLTGNVEAEDALLAASARAQRNWLRATRELAALQTARASHLLCRAAKEADVPPCADLTRVPKRGAASKAMTEAHCDSLIDRAMRAAEKEVA